MEKIVKINGMACSHCAGRVEKALSALNSVDLKN
ncbi:MAG: cation transporter [Clostridia bacterium]|nr:cation transporter [Clostridia bacterium]